MTRKGLSQLRKSGELSGMSEETPSYGAVTPFDVLVNHFESRNFRFHADPDSKCVQFFITGDCAIYNCRLQLTHDGEVLQVRANYPIAARDPKIRPLVAEALARANHGMSIGRLDIDMDSGEMNFHISQVIRDHGLDDEGVGAVFATAMSTADRYFPAIMRVMFAGHTPADAVYLSELDVHVESVESVEAKPNPAPMPPKPAAKKPRRSRRSSSSGAPGELPGLFDRKPIDGDRC
jgi:hypothetical protein